MNDAFTICGHAIPDRERVGACLAQNINRISSPCRTVMLRYSRTNQPATASRAKLTPQLIPTGATPIEQISA